MVAKTKNKKHAAKCPFISLLSQGGRTETQAEANKNQAALLKKSFSLLLVSFHLSLGEIVAQKFLIVIDLPLEITCFSLQGFEKVGEMYSFHFWRILVILLLLP